MELPLDYATLKVLWWGLVGVLLIGYALTDGYDLGVASLLPFVAKNGSRSAASSSTPSARCGKATRCG
jgi:cytochrome d ubiquinol oxidase subunit II